MRSPSQLPALERALDEAVEAFLRATRHLDGEPLAEVVRTEVEALLATSRGRRGPVAAAHEVAA